MRHRLHSNRLSRPTGARKALLRRMAASVILEGKIRTTWAKAKVVAGVVDSLAASASKGKEYRQIRKVMSKLPSGDLGEKASRALFDHVEGAKRQTGFVRVLKLAKRRKGDGAEMAQVELIALNEGGDPDD